MAHTPLLSMVERIAGELRASDRESGVHCSVASRRGFALGAAAAGRCGDMAAGSACTRGCCWPRANCHCGCASFGSGTPQSRAEIFANQLEPVFPGISRKLNGRSTIDFWPASPYQRDSYSYWKVGQYQAFAGAERERSGRCHFAGEHTSVDFQGYLNGAVESGQRASAEILGDYK